METKKLKEFVEAIINLNKTLDLEYDSLWNNGICITEDVLEIPAKKIIKVICDARGHKNLTGDMYAFVYSTEDPQKLIMYSKSNGMRYSIVFYNDNITTYSLNGINTISSTAADAAKELLILMRVANRRTFILYDL